MEIVRYPHPALRWKSRPIRQIDEHIKRTVAEMFELMYAANGVGLAANQVGLPWRLFVINPAGDPKATDLEQVFINPEISGKKGSVEGEEGCLSMPDLYGPVARADHIVVSAYGLDGRGFEMKLKDLPSRVVQHENDHLDGILFTDRLPEDYLADAELFLEEWERQFERRQKSGEIPPLPEIEQQLKELEAAL